MKRKVINAFKKEIKSAFGVDKLASLVIKICKDELSNALTSNTMEMNTIIEYMQPGCRAPFPYVAIIQTYQKIFGKNFKTDILSIWNNNNLFKASLDKDMSRLKIPRQGIYYKKLDQKTILMLIVTTSVNGNKDEDDDIQSICRVEIVQLIIGGNRRKWKSKIIAMNDKHLTLLNGTTKRQPITSMLDKDEVPSPVIRIDNISKDNVLAISNRMVRPLNNIIFPEKDEIMEKIQNFMDGFELYKQTSIPYKIGILLHGIHGTGKTSFALSLAYEYNIPITFLDLSFFDTDNPDLGLLDDMLKTTLPLSGMNPYHSNAAIEISMAAKRLTIDKPKYRIIVIDEIDTQLSPDEMDISNNSKIITKRILRLLNALDSVGNGAIVIATTNHVNRLDPRLIRSGRFDYIYELKDLDKSYCTKLLLERGIDEPEKLLKDKDFPYNPSKLEQDLISYIITENNLCNTHKIDIKELMGDDVDSIIDDVESDSTDENIKSNIPHVLAADGFHPKTSFIQQYSTPVMPDDFDGDKISEYTIK